MTNQTAESEWDEAHAVSMLVSALVDTISNVRALAGMYAGEPHASRCGLDACLRCVVAEFASLVDSPVEKSS